MFPFNLPLRLLARIAGAMAYSATVLISAEEEPIEHEISFSVYSFSRIPNLALATAEGDLVPIRFYSGSVSPPMDYEGPSPLRFFHLTREADQTFDPASLPAARINLESLGNQLLLIFAPRSQRNPEGDRTYGIFPMDIDPRVFPPGSLMVFNALGRPIAGVVGGERFQIRTGPSPLFRVRRETTVQIATQFEERTAIIHRGPVEVAPDERAILFLLPPFVRGSIEAQYRLIRIPLPEDFSDQTEPEPS